MTTMDKPKLIRVLHFIPAFSIGGMESLIMSLYRCIDRTQVQFDFLVETQEWNSDFKSIEKLGGQVLQIKPLNKKKPLAYLKQIKDFFNQHAHNYVAVHCHNIERSVIVLHYAKKYGIKCRIIHAHNDSVVDARFESITKLIIRLNNKLSTHFFACSVSAGEFYFKKDRVRYSVLKNAIDTQVFSYKLEKRNAMRKELGIKGSFVIGHTGRFTFLKNHWKIIDVFNEIHKKQSNAVLLLVGDGPVKAEIQEKIQKLELGDSVILTGNKRNVADYLQCMDVFLLPSFAEGFCISLLEAQSTGLPSVTSEVIPDEVQLTDIIIKLPLELDHQLWANEVLSYENNIRFCQHDIIKEKGYDTQENSQLLMEFYLNEASNTQ
jgi:glycosyltransferase involved in cell wall biosynthesis